MAKPVDRFEDNTLGPWYVDKQCILCSVCSELAPKNFRESAHGDHDVVYKQPETSQEEVQCHQAMRECPVDAIGNDFIAAKSRSR
jgi:ferredoxin